MAPPTTAIHFSALGPVDLRRSTGDEVRALLVQPKRLALFAYLALEAPSLERRDTLLALFWPDSSPEAARHSLSQALHFFRRELGPDVITTRGNDAVGVRDGAVRSDVAELEHAIADGRCEDALALYRGPLLQGLSASGVSAEYEQWLDAKRARLHALAMRCAHALTDAAERERNWALAARHAQDAVRLDPLDERSVRRAMALLDRAGDRGGALRAYETFADRLARELEGVPSRETRELADRLRGGESDAGRNQGDERSRDGVASGAEPDEAAASRALGRRAAPVTNRPSSVASRRSVWNRIALVAAAVGAITAAAVAARAVAARPTRPILAVGSVRVSAPGDTLLSPALFRDLIATDLARVSDLRVVTGDPIQAVLARADSAGGSAAALADASRRAGATALVEAIVSGGVGEPLRADVRVVSLADGTIEHANTVRAPDAFALADRLTAQVASALGSTPPTVPLASVTSTSLTARRLYEEGIRRYDDGDNDGAFRLFRSALDDDSTFVMAAYYASLSGWPRGDTLALRYMAHALRMSRRSPERERLLIATVWAVSTNSPASVVMAESLATRFPLDSDGERYLGQVLMWAGDRGRALGHLRRALARDSATGADAPADGARRVETCRRCGTLGFIIQAYEEGDSLGPAEREARAWTVREPSRPGAWTTLATVYELEGRLDSALAAERRASQLAGRDLADGIYRARLAIRGGDFATADRLLTDRAVDGDPSARFDALWWLTISLRQQGRMREALDANDRLIREEDLVAGRADSASVGRLVRAQLVMELGRAREAVDALTRMAAIPARPIEGAPAGVSGVSARRRAWVLAHVSTSWAALGDSAHLVTLVDTLERVGSASAYGRDQRLHWYARGLLLEARGDSAAAVGVFRRAIWSPNNGFTRVNYELARALLATGLPAEAAAVLRSALRGSLEGSTMYVTRTELHETLARALEAAGDRDAARAEYAAVAAAWRNGDPPFRARAARALAAVGRR